MKDLTLGIITTLKADTAVAALVSTRIYRQSANMVWDRSSSIVVVGMIDDIRNADTNTGRYANARIQVSSYATSELAARTLDNTCADCLHGKVNTFLSTGTGADKVWIAGIEDAGAVIVPHPGNVGVYAWNRDYVIEYTYR